MGNGLLIGAGFSTLFFLAAEGCSADANKRVVDALVKKALAECVAENAHLGDVELQAACGFASDLWPIVRDLVMAQRRGLAKAAAARDAGAADAAKD